MLEEQLEEQASAKARMDGRVDGWTDGRTKSSCDAQELASCHHVLRFFARSNAQMSFVDARRRLLSFNAMTKTAAAVDHKYLFY